jgi:hypothetical protein
LAGNFRHAVSVIQLFCRPLTASGSSKCPCTNPPCDSTCENCRDDEGQNFALEARGLTVTQLGKRVYREINEDEVFTRSAALAYYFFAALIPMVFS